MIKNNLMNESTRFSSKYFPRSETTFFTDLNSFIRGQFVRLDNSVTEIVREAASNSAALLFLSPDCHRLSKLSSCANFYRKKLSKDRKILT